MVGFLLSFYLHINIVRYYCGRSVPTRPIVVCKGSMQSAVRKVIGCGVAILTGFAVCRFDRRCEIL